MPFGKQINNMLSKNQVNVVVNINTEEKLRAAMVTKRFLLHSQLGVKAENFGWELEKKTPRFCHAGKCF